ncbi:SDR family NAD(P)-dependent oxidoreductase [Ruegeria jejuensis]|uniref:SDR family NAD(P)-dependent oxidoreductase n=1 Tax=Ruegeria jejuensis TaxID=3233338 RepID=UPI00355B1CA7
MNIGTCIITGVGPGTGTALTRRFTQAGYTVAMIARDADRLEALSTEMADAHAYPCDVTDFDAIDKTLAAIKQTHGPTKILVHNAIGGAFGDFMSIDPAILDRNFRINTSALLHLARALAPDMIEAGEGAILATGNTSAYRGKSMFAGFAPTKAAQRILLESIARHVGPQGVHAAYVAIDAVIDVPWTRERFADKPDDFFCRPDDIAEVVYQTAHQPRSAWSSDIVIRPFGEIW